MPHPTEQHEEGLPEWIMSYADMITILMAFFVVMYSMAGVPEKTKEAAVLKSFKERFGPEWINQMLTIGTGGFLGIAPVGELSGSPGGRDKGREKNGGSKPRLRGSESKQGSSLRPGDTPSVGATIFFPDNNAELTLDHDRKLRAAAEEFAGKALRIEVRGHSSRQGPRQDRDHDPWDLAYLRARQTMDHLIKLGIDPRRLRLSVAADNEPLSEAVNPTIRTKSARVEVFMLNELIDDALPHKAGA